MIIEDLKRKKELIFTVLFPFFPSFFSDHTSSGQSPIIRAQVKPKYTWLDHAAYS